MLTVVEPFGRQSGPRLAYSGRDVVAALDQVVGQAECRVDQGGSRYGAHLLEEWAARLNVTQFLSLEDTREQIDRRRGDYNARPSGRRANN
jgi:hypothetical protein